MRHQGKLATILVAAGFLFFSCNSGDNKASDKAADTSAAKKDSGMASTPAPVAAGPMLVMTVTHKVANYAKWKASYDAHDSSRLSYGLHNYVITRGVEDSNMVMVAMRMDDVNKAKEFAGSKDLMERMKKAGVSHPVMAYEELVFNDTTPMPQATRVMVRHKVKDWTAWKKVFDSDKEARAGAGLTDRVVSHAVGDDHDVTLIFAIADTAKANAFMHSKALQDKMKEGGVEGQPTHWLYRIAAKY